MISTRRDPNPWYPKGQSYPSVDFGVRLSNFCDLNSHHGKQSIWGKACLKKDYHLCMLRQFCNFSQKTDPQQADTVTWFEILQLAGRTPQVRYKLYMYMWIFIMKFLVFCIGLMIVVYMYLHSTVVEWYCEVLRCYDRHWYGIWVLLPWKVWICRNESINFWEVSIIIDDSKCQLHS